MGTNGARLSRLGLAMILIVTTLTIGVTAAALVRASRPQQTLRHSLNLSFIPQGVSGRSLGGTPIFFVRVDDQVEAFLTDVQHLRGENRLWWCPNERIFASPTHAELFDTDGDAIGGPAARGLSRASVAVSANVVRVDLGKVELSTRPKQQTALIQFTDKWDAGSDSFCANAIRSERL